MCYKVDLEKVLVEKLASSVADVAVYLWPYLQPSNWPQPLLYSAFSSRIIIDEEKISDYAERQRKWRDLMSASFMDMLPKEKK